MNHLQQEAFFIDEKKALDLSSQLLDVRISQIDCLDVDAEFAKIVTQAQRAGLGKDELLRELSCSWSTVTRWAAGQVRPAPFTRRLTKHKLVEMLKGKRLDNLDEARRIKVA